MDELKITMKEVFHFLKEQIKDGYVYIAFDNIVFLMETPFLYERKPIKKFLDNEKDEYVFGARWVVNREEGDYKEKVKENDNNSNSFFSWSVRVDEKYEETRNVPNTIKITDYKNIKIIQCLKNYGNPLYIGCEKELEKMESEIYEYIRTMTHL